MNQDFTIRYEKGQHLRRWLYTEPVCLDVSHLYENNYNVPFETYREYTNRFLSAADSLSPCEGGEETLLGMQTSWRLLRMADGDVKPTWAVFGTNANLLANYAFCQVCVPTAGTYSCALNTVGAAMVWINGHLCLEHMEFRRTGNQNLTFSAELNAGVNTLLIALWNVHLHATNSFALYFTDTEVTVTLPLLSSENREALENDFSKLYLAETVTENLPVLCAAEPLKCSGQFLWSVTDSGKPCIPPRTFRITEETGLSLPLSEAEQLPTGMPFSVSVCYIPNGSDKPIQGPAFSFERLNCTSVPKTDYAQRCEFLKEKYAKWAELPQSAVKFRILYACLAKLAFGQDCPTEWLERGLAYINARYDCADFGMHALLRILYLYSEQLSPKLLEKAKECVLNFKYNEDDGGRSMMFCRSENHRILFASLEYLAGRLFPHERFAQSGEQGIFHQQRGRTAVEKWIREKGCYGFMEWHSNTYYEEDMIAMLNLCDFGAEYDEIQTRAKNMLDFISVLMASHSSGGIMATTHGRCYEKNLFYPKTEPTAHLVWLLCGTAESLACMVSTGALCLLTSGYRPDKTIEETAREPILETRSRMGLFFQRGMDGVPCYTYRCPEYMVSAALEYRSGICGAQVQTGQILLEQKVPVFCTSFENASEHTRPSYWGGQYRTPRAVATDHLLAYAYHIETTEGATHFYFPIPLMDEVQSFGRWIVGRKGKAYIAVFCSADFNITKTGVFSNRELLCSARDAIWILQLGTETEFQTFSAFCKAVTESVIQETDGGICYDSPTCGKISLSFYRSATQNGAPYATENYPLIENKFVTSEYGSGIHRLQKRILNFKD